MDKQAQISNMQKYFNYQEQMVRLKKAMAAQFYLEAIFIEYAVMEYRLESILRHSGVFNPERHSTIQAKLRRVSEPVSYTHLDVYKRQPYEKLKGNVIYSHLYYGNNHFKFYID